MQTTLSDDELLRLMRAGDERAFLELYQGRGGAIYRFALRMSGSEAIAEDVTQDVFMSLINDLVRFDSARGSLTSYLFGIARNQVLRRIEKDRFLTPIVDDQPDDNLVSMTDPLSDLTRRETIESVRQAVLALPVHYREVVVLCDLHEMSYVDAAEALGCALGTVRSRLHRARALLVEKLRPGRRSEAPTTRAGAIRSFV
ncbi:MAG: RNA polymerase sigma factor [Acidobacteria bacterium]|nr:RNA polymerase sigma factor [Acidobacteriota bacterium]